MPPAKAPSPPRPKKKKKKKPAGVKKKPAQTEGDGTEDDSLLDVLTTVFDRTLVYYAILASGRVVVPPATTCESWAPWSLEKAMAECEVPYKPGRSPPSALHAVLLPEAVGAEAAAAADRLLFDKAAEWRAALKVLSGDGGALYCGDGFEHVPAGARRDALIEDGLVDAAGHPTDDTCDELIDWQAHIDFVRMQKGDVAAKARYDAWASARGEALQRAAAEALGDLEEEFADVPLEQGVCNGCDDE